MSRGIKIERLEASGTIPRPIGTIARQAESNWAAQSITEGGAGAQSWAENRNRRHETSFAQRRKLIEPGGFPEGVPAVVTHSRASRSFGWAVGEEDRRDEG